MDNRIVVHPPKQDSSKRYYITVSYYINGKRKQRRKSGFEKSREAKSAGEEMKKRLQNILPTLALTGGESPTFKEFAVQYNRIMDVKWSDGTRKIRSASLDKCDFTHKKLPDINRMDLEQNLGRLKGLYKYNTLNSILSGWNVYLNAARDYGYIQVAPKIRLDQPKEDKKIKALSINKAWELYDKVSDPEMKLLVLIGFTTGLRIGEIVDLSDSDIDYEKGVINVCHQWLDNPRPGRRNAPLKTNNSYRLVPLSERTLRAIREYPVRTVTGHLFPRPGGLGKRAWWAFKVTGIEASPHTLRHTYVTELIRSRQFDLQSVAALAGDTIQTILKTYSHYLEEAAEENREKIRQLFI